ncbi:MAG: DNA gyrase inhibitor YacG [Bdellovibrionales bacterium RBG_16_40_8]|nr:MAG: DNA gyrase inhibitor YacG [Bdellovibrionales bacterium RBG_16_40_8]
MKSAKKKLVNKKLVKCPSCGKSAEYSSTNVYRPFCGERCQIIDLGDWASEKYAIPTAEPDVENDGDEDGKI